MVHSRLVALNAAGKGEPQSKHLGLMLQLGYECVQNGALAVVNFFNVYFGYCGNECKLSQATILRITMKNNNLFALKERKNSRKSSLAAAIGLKLSLIELLWQVEVFLIKINWFRRKKSCRIKLVKLVYYLWYDGTKLSQVLGFQFQVSRSFSRSSPQGVAVYPC